MWAVERVDEYVAEITFVDKTEAEIRTRKYIFPVNIPYDATPSLARVEWHLQTSISSIEDGDIVVSVIGRNFMWYEFTQPRLFSFLLKKRSIWRGVNEETEEVVEKTTGESTQSQDTSEKEWKKGSVKSEKTV